MRSLHLGLSSPATASDAQRRRTKAFASGLLVLALSLLVVPFRLIFAAAVFMLFAQVGISWFGGDIYRENPRLVNTSFADSNYYDSNFNDFGSALVTLFELLIVNNWQVQVAAYVATNGLSARIFFISFWLVSSVLVINLLVAYILDAFFRKQAELRKKDEANEKVAKEEEAALALEGLEPQDSLRRKRRSEWRQRLHESREEIAKGEHITVEDCMKY